MEIDFSVEDLVVRARERYSVGMTDWKGVFGTASIEALAEAMVDSKLRALAAAEDDEYMRMAKILLQAQGYKR